MVASLLAGPLVGPVAVDVTLRVAPVPPERRQAPLYFPTTAGTTWAYQLNDGREYTDVVTKVEPGAGEATVSVARRTPEGIVHPSSDKYVVSTRGLLRVEGCGIKKDRPEWLLKLPYKVEQTWETGGEQDMLDPFPSQKCTHLAIGEEVVAVPAGTYKALRVTEKYHQIPGCMMDPPPPATVWYAPGVGVVKITMGKTVWVLKSFERGVE